MEMPESDVFRAVDGEAEAFPWMDQGWRDAALYAEGPQIDAAGA